MKVDEGPAVLSGSVVQDIPARKNGLREWVGHAIKSVIAGLILFALIRWEIIRFADVKSAISDPVILFQAGLCVLAMILVTVWRWKILLHSQGVEIRFLALFRVYYLSLACAPVLPGGVGGDALRIAYTIRLTADRKVMAAASVFIDRLLATVGVVFVAFFLILPHVPRAIGGEAALLSLLVLLSGLFVGCILFITMALLSGRRVGISRWLHDHFQNRLVRMIVEVFDAIAAYRFHPKTIIAAIAMSTANQIFIVVAVVIIAGRLGFIGFSVADMGIASMLTQIANVLPLTPGGIGVGEVAFDQILTILTSPDATAGYGSIFLTFRVLSIIVTLPGIFGIFSR